MGFRKNNSNGTFRIHPATDMSGGKSLDVANGSGNNGTNIQIHNNNGYPAQNFKLVKASNDGGYYLMTESSGFKSCVEVKDASKTNGANVIQYQKLGGDNQVWFFESAPWPASNGKSNNNPQPKPSSSNILSNGWYYIKNINSQKYVEVTNGKDANGANVAQFQGNDSSCQKWYVTNLGNNYITLKTGLPSGRMMDVYNGENKDGANVQIFDRNGADAQTFKVVKSSNGAVCLLSKSSGETKALDVYGSSADNNANLNLWTYSGIPCQQFLFEAIGGGSSSQGGASGNTSGNKEHVDGSFPTQQINMVNCQNGKMVTGSSINKGVSSNANSSTANRWTVSFVGNGVFKIVNVNTGYVLAPSNNNASNGASVVTTGSTSSKAQWWVVKASKNDDQGTGLNYTIVNYANQSLALTVSGNGYVLAGNSKSASQSFRINSYGLEGFGGYCKDMYGREKACTIGGLLGETVKVNNVSELQKYANGSTPYTIVINNNISANALTKVNVGRNKTFIGSYGRNTLYNIHFRNISNSGNNIYKNITFSHDVRINNNDDIQMYISDGPNFWLDHCTWTGHDMYKDENIHHNDTDKFVYVGLKASFVTVSACNFGGHKYGLILGYPQENGRGTYDGYPCMTICNNYFHSTITRAPGLMRYGNYHVYNNYIYDFNIGYTPYTDCTIFSEKNCFEKGKQAGAPINGNGNNSHFVDYGSTTDQSYYKIYNIGTVNWNPSSNYSYKTRNAADAKAWALSNAGSRSSGRLAYAVD
ncbi:Pectate lyase [Lachnospiraceae bacterium C7]|nr:Pectate lyase [Lachnospiraceae bacterium C7]